jgi:hypothetical protein
MRTSGVATSLFAVFLSCSAGTAAHRADTVVLVNSASSSYLDALHFTQAYLDQFGVPYTLLDVARTPVTPAIGDYALIIIGHGNLDVTGRSLDDAEQASIATAVRNGSGLINFDTHLSRDGRQPAYRYVQDIFGFGYSGDPPTASGVLFSPSAGTHYVTARHQPGESVEFGTVATPGITLSPRVTVLARFVTVDQPFLAVTEYGKGRAVQFGCGNWMPQYIKGGVYGLDDLVWRSLVWAARKPFVMQGLPNFLTMRVDDVRGGFWWARTANEFGFVPWMGVFYNDISELDAEKLANLVSAGKATASVHGKSAKAPEVADGDFFYFDHYAGHDYTNEQMTANFDEATAWHRSHNIPISKYVVGHFYELGTNAFAGLKGWGVQFVGTQMPPGGPYNSSKWLTQRAYRVYEPAQAAANSWPGAYADFLDVPGRPEFQNTFFNCVTEIRDDAGYEWSPNDDVTATIGRGTRQLKRAMDSMVLATLFTHEYHIQPIEMSHWRDELQGIVNNLAPYNPRQVSMDYACQYVRAMATSSIQSSSYDPATGNLTTTLAGSTDLPTQFMLFLDAGSGILQTMVDVPSFSGSSQIVKPLNGPLDHIVVTPQTPFVPTAGTLTFTAQGYDAGNVPIPGLRYDWTASAGGSIDPSGRFHAGSAAGTFSTAVTVSSGAVAGHADVEVYVPTFDHLAFDPIVAPVHAGTPFGLRITAVDQHAEALPSYVGPTRLSDGTGTILPAQTGKFVGGIWAGTVTIAKTATADTIAATDGAATGTSGAFDVVARAPSEIEFNCADDAHQKPVLATTTDPNALNAAGSRWIEFWYQCCRAHPTVFAAAGEASAGRPVMRFFATGIADGTYEVRAKLYTNDPGRDMRYYYGFSPSAPKALFVDTVGGAGGTEQLAEYSLGTIDIRGGTFDIYVQDAKLLSGSYVFFGWASIRLLPQIDPLGSVAPGG